MAGGSGYGCLAKPNGAGGGPHGRPTLRRHAPLALCVLLLPLLLSTSVCAHDAAAQPAAPLTTANAAAGEGAAMCATLSFPMYVAAAVGYFSRPAAFMTCPAAGPSSSSLVDDVRGARLERAASRGVLARLLDITRGDGDADAYYLHHAADFLALEAEVQREVCVLRAMGMWRTHFNAVLNALAAVLRLDQDAPLVPPITANATEEEVEKSWRGLNRLRAAFNRSITAAPHLLPSLQQRERAKVFFRDVVAASVVVRAFEVPSDGAATVNRDVIALLRVVQRVWNTAQDVVAREESREAAVAGEPSGSAGTPGTSPTYLPTIHFRDFVSTEEYDSDPTDYGTRPLRRQVPSAVIYHACRGGAACDVYNGVFDLLPAAFKTMCGQLSEMLVSCSPVTLFVRVQHDSNATDDADAAASATPRLQVYSRVLHSREAVLRSAENAVMLFGASKPHRDVADEVGDETPHYGLQFLQRGGPLQSRTAELDPLYRFSGVDVPLLQVEEGATLSVADAMADVLRRMAEHGILQIGFLSARQAARVKRRNAALEARLQRQRQTELEADAAQGNATVNTSSTLPPVNATADPRHKTRSSLHAAVRTWALHYLNRTVGSAALVSASSSHLEAMEQQAQQQRHKDAGWAWSRLCAGDTLVVVVVAVACMAQWRLNKVHSVQYW